MVEEKDKCTFRMSTLIVKHGVGDNVGGLIGSLAGKDWAALHRTGRLRTLSGMGALDGIAMVLMTIWTLV